MESSGAVEPNTCHGLMAQTVLQESIVNMACASIKSMNMFQLRVPGAFGVPLARAQGPVEGESRSLSANVTDPCPEMGGSIVLDAG